MCILPHLYIPFYYRLFFLITEAPFQDFPYIVYINSVKSCLGKQAKNVDSNDPFFIHAYIKKHFYVYCTKYNDIFSLMNIFSFLCKISEKSHWNGDFWQFPIFFKSLFPRIEYSRILVYNKHILLQTPYGTKGETEKLQKGTFCALQSFCLRFLRLGDTCILIHLSLPFRGQRIG